MDEVVYEMAAPEPGDASWSWTPAPPPTRATTTTVVPLEEHHSFLDEEPVIEEETPAEPESAVDFASEPEVETVAEQEQEQIPDPGPAASLPAAPVPAAPAVPPMAVVPAAPLVARPRQSTASPPQPVTPPAASPTARRPILNEEHDKAEQLGLPARNATSYMVAGVRHGNKRRSASLVKLLLLVFFINLLVVGALGAWLYNYFVGQVETRMAEFSNRPLPIAPPAPGAAPAEATGGAAEAEIKKLKEEFESQNADLKAQLQAAQSRLTEAEASQQQQQARIATLATQVANAAASSSAANGSKSPATKAVPVPAAETVAAAIVPGSVVDGGQGVTQSELILLKERNKLTNYADEAISTGSRRPYERLWEALEDERLIQLVHAARTEILRVQNFYLTGSRIDSYSIQVADYFPDDAALRDSQLKDEQLIELLATTKNPWQVRMKAANILGNRRSKVVGDALVKAVKTDENLDVVKEATFSFEQMTGFRARLFEPASMDAWWAQYNAVPMLPPKKATAQNSTPEPAPGAPPAPDSQPPAKEVKPELRLPEWEDEGAGPNAGKKKPPVATPVPEEKKAEDKTAEVKKQEEKKPDDKKAEPKKKEKGNG